MNEDVLTENEAKLLRQIQIEAKEWWVTDHRGFTMESLVDLICKFAMPREKQLEAEKKLNAEIKARFVKCNTCTDEMKNKCLMFSENLCEGERCEELVDLMSLVNKSESDEKLAKAKELLKNIFNFEDGTVTDFPRFNLTQWIIEARQFLKESEEIK